MQSSSSLSPQDLQHVILTAGMIGSSTNGTISADQAKVASKYLDALRSNPVICVTKCLELLKYRMDQSVGSRDEVDNHVVFFILSSFQIGLTKASIAENNYDRDRVLAPNVREDIRNGVLTYLNQYIIALEQFSTNNGASVMPPFLQTKLAVVLAKYIHLEYPNGSWPGAFEHLMELLSKIDLQDERQRAASLLKIGIFVRTLDAVSDEIIMFRSERGKEEVNRNVLIKNSLKSNNSLILQKLLGSSGLMMVLEKVERYKDIVILILTTLKRYIGWVDWSIVVSQEHNILHHIAACIRAGTQIAVLGLECFLELMDRTTDMEQKIFLLTRLNIFATLPSIDLDEDIDLSIKIAEVDAAVGIELLIYYDEVLDEQHTNSKTNMDRPDSLFGAVESLLNQTLQLFWKCFAYDDIDVTGAVIPFAQRLVNTLGKQMERSNETCIKPTFNVLEHIPNLVSIMYKQLCYPNDFRFDYTDEDDAEEEMFRSNLRKVNKKITQLLPNESLQYLCNVLSNLPMPLSSATTCELEASLRLVFHYCEGLSAKDASSAVEAGPFRQVIIALHQSNVFEHHHFEVIALYYDIAVRYASILRSDSNLLSKVLSAMSGSQGIQHSHPRVRSRSCYLLLKLVKEMGPVLRPFVVTAVGGIKGMIFSVLLFNLIRGNSDFFLEMISRQQTELQSGDILNLFETMGILIGKTQLPLSDQKEYLIAVITPHVSSINDLISSSELIRDPETFGEVLATLIAAISSLSKGFSKPCAEIKSIMMETVPILLAALKALPSDERVRVKTIVTLHRMILVLGHDILNPITPFLQILIFHCSYNDITDVTQLLNQLCSKFKSSVVQTINAAVIPFLQKCHSIIPEKDNNDEIAPHLDTEQLLVRKLGFVFLQHIVSKKATKVLVSEINKPNLENVLAEMKYGAVEVVDPSIRKSCILFFKGLLDQWSEVGSVDDIIRTGFVGFITSSLLPDLLKGVMDSNFDVSDAMNIRVVVQTSKLLEILQAQYHSHYNHFMGNFLQNSVCAASTATAFSSASTSAEIEKCLLQMRKDILKNIR